MKLYIDPGLGGTGWAVFDGNDCKEYGVIRAKGKDLVERCGSIWYQFLILLSYYDFEECSIEFPGLWGSSKSHMSAASGDLFKLTFLIGGLGHVCDDNNIPLRLISPQEWKGQLPKAVVIARIKRVFPDFDKVPNHAADSVGMGLADLGLLNHD